MVESLTPEQRTERLNQIIDLAREARGLVLSKTVALEPKIGEILSLALCPEPGPRRLMHSLVLGSWLGLDRKIELLDAVIDAEYPGIVDPNFKDRLGTLNSLRNAAAHYDADDSDDALELVTQMHIRLVGYRRGKLRQIEITTSVLEAAQRDMDLIVDDLEKLVPAIRQRRNLPAPPSTRFPLPPDL
jgi:hypothetical protein